MKIVPCTPNVLFAIILTLTTLPTHQASAQSLLIPSQNNELLCYLSDPTGPRLFSREDTGWKETSFEEITNAGSKSIRKLSKKLKRQKRKGAGKKKIRRTRLKRKSVTQANTEVLACQESSLSGLEFFNASLVPGSGSITVPTKGFPEATLGGNCTLTYYEAPTDIGEAISKPLTLAEKTLVDITCTMDGTASSAVTGEIVWGPSRSNANVMSFIAGLNQEKDTFQITSCDFKVGVDCDETYSMAIDFNDRSALAELYISFTFAGARYVAYLN